MVLQTWTGHVTGVTNRQSFDLPSYSHHKNFQGCENIDSRSLTVEDPGYFMLNMQELSRNYWDMFMQLYRQKAASPSVC